MEIRNVAIIAHVDHGKTTLVDALLRQSQTRIKKETDAGDLILDSHELERERGLTIFSKNAGVVWHDVKINIIDTPGHADFSGEVERVLKMADGALLLVDAQEGPMPQTTFVLKKALELKLKIIIVINKIDKAHANLVEALNKTYDLFIDLGADESGLESPVIYAAGKLGRAGLGPDLNQMSDVTPLFQKIVDFIPAPSGDPQAPLQMLVTAIGFDNFRGRLARGRIYNGTLKSGQEVMRLDRQGKMTKTRLTSLAIFNGLEAEEVSQAPMGEIVLVSGLAQVMIGETIADAQNPIPLPLLAIEEPTVSLNLGVNSSPRAGQEGDYSTSRQIRERLYKELDHDVALRVSQTTEGKFLLDGRGELHLAILLERLRREGYEFEVSQPKVIRQEIDGVKNVPYDQVFVETPEAHAGAVIAKLQSRGAEMRSHKIKNDVAHLEFIVPTQGLFGYRREFLTDTRGLGLLNTLFYKYQPEKAMAQERERGSLVASQSGLTRTYGLVNLQDRGDLFLAPGAAVYKGQIVGQNSRREDLRVNVCKEKQLSNMRSKGEGGLEHLKAPRTMALEDALEYIDGTELVEITPKNVRLRKIILDENEEKRRRKGLRGSKPRGPSPTA